MKNSIYLLFSTIVFAVTSLNAEIYETRHFAELCHHIQPDSLVLVDIDDTLMIPVQTLGSDVWFSYQLEKNRQTVSSQEDALEKTLFEWQAVRFLSEMQHVEKGVEAIVGSLQKQGVAVMGLTTQGLALANCTLRQLKQLNIDLSLTAPSQGDFYTINGTKGILFRHGILFTAGTLKGEALMKYCQSINKRPKHVVFINDKLSHLKDVEKTLENENILFTGLRYSFSDERVAAFSSQIAELQFEQFKFILSDGEAKEILQRRSED